MNQRRFPLLLSLIAVLSGCEPTSETLAGVESFQEPVHARNMCTTIKLPTAARFGDLDGANLWPDSIDQAVTLVFMKNSDLFVAFGVDLSNQRIVFQLEIPYWALGEFLSMDSTMIKNINPKANHGQVTQLNKPLPRVPLPRGGEPLAGYLYDLAARLHTTMEKTTTCLY